MNHPLNEPPLNEPPLASHRCTLALVLAALLGMSCGSRSTDSSPNGSETHFLSACVDSCDFGLECLNSVCTRPCENDSSCEALDAAATCSVGSDGQSSCQVLCTQDVECGSAGAGSSCQQGRCVQGQSPEGWSPAGQSSEGQGLAADDTAPGPQSTVSGSSGDASGQGSESAGPVGVGCTAVGCEDGVSVMLVPPDGVVSPGEFWVRVVIDGQTTLECSASYASGTTRPDCAFEELSLFVSPGEECREPVPSGEEACVRREEMAVGIRINGTPTQLDIEYTSSEGEIYSVTSTPEYQTLQPNGPQCEPTCFHAGETFFLEEQ